MKDVDKPLMLTELIFLTKLQIIHTPVYPVMSFYICLSMIYTIILQSPFYNNVEHGSRNRPLQHTPCWKIKQYNLSSLGNEIYCNAKIFHCSVIQYGVCV